MKKLIRNLNAYLKGLVFFLRPGLFLGWVRRPFLFTSNLLSLSKWMTAQDRKNILNDFYTFKRDYSKRIQLYQYIINTHNLNNEAIDYIEFGVFEGHSFKWWVAHNSNSNSNFYGFDTFEGLPENWGTFNKNDMTANIPVIDDSRVKFIKGLFQESVPGFLSDTVLKNGKRKIIHLDADLFSSTLYALTSMAPYLKEGDILMFDEFNVPNHEFYAFKIFCDSYYIKTKLIGAVNNYYQVALMIVK